MRASAETIAYYDEHADDFCKSTVCADMHVCLEEFLSYLPVQGLILDAGCGSGRDSRYLLDRGYQVEACDASKEICAWAEKHIGIPVSCFSFEEMEIREKYDGIWACASLLHVAAADMEDVFFRLCRALKTGGILYASFKYGEGERIKDGRHFTDYTENALKRLAEKTGFSVMKCFLTQDVRAEYKEQKWVNLIAGKEKLCALV